MPASLIEALRALARRHGYRNPDEILEETAARKAPWWTRCA